MQKILIINGHPDKESFCAELAKQYKNGADKSGAECNLINLTDLNFSPVLQYGYRKRTDLEPDLQNVWEYQMQTNWFLFIQIGGVHIRHY